MAQRPRQIEDRLAVSLIDLRAHFEAQLRTVARAEHCLLQCRGARDRVVFDAAAVALRGETRTIAGYRRAAGDLVGQAVADAAALIFDG